jgi:hypothetical protein
MNKDDKLDFENLRKRVEAFLKEKPTVGGMELSEADQLKFIHELEVYKVELELQQQELMMAKDRVENLTQKYDELVDLHNRFIIHMLKTGKSLE